MFNDDRSDFAAPIVGFLYIGFAAIMTGIYSFCGGAEIFVYSLDSNVFYYVGVAGLVIAGFNLYKAYIPEGVTIGLVAFLAFTMQGMFTVIGEDDTFIVGASAGAAMALLVLFVLSAVICFLRGFIDLTVINGVLGAASFFVTAWSGPHAVFIIGGILCIVAAGVALFVAFVDWNFAQDVLESLEDDFCCDDDECCCDEHGEDCCCEECKPADEESAEAPAEEPVEAEVVEETETSENTE